jgi:hypothetical protein
MSLMLLSCASLGAGWLRAHEFRHLESFSDRVVEALDDLPGILVLTFGALHGLACLKEQSNIDSELVDVRGRVGSLLTNLGLLT